LLNEKVLNDIMQENNKNISQNLNLETTSEESIGQTIKRVRLEKNIRIENAASETKLKVAYLNAIENDDFDALPAPIYAKNFIRIYGNYLGLDGVELSKRYNSKNIGIIGLPPQKKTASTYYISLFFNFLFRHPFVLLGIAVVLAVLIFYPSGSDSTEPEIKTSYPAAPAADETFQPASFDDYQPVFDINEPFPKS
jgi:transcriptional regulator with XRE-family HTH domain